MNRRLEGMNEFREQLKDQAAQFITSGRFALVKDQVAHSVTKAEFAAMQKLV